MDAPRAAADSVRPGGAFALSRAHRAHRHQDAVLAVVLGTRLSGLRPRRSIEPRGAAADARAGRRELVRASGHDARRRSAARRRRACRWSWCRTRCSATSTRSSWPVSGATSSARPTPGTGCSTWACRLRRLPAPMRWWISSGRWRSARRACTSRCQSRSRWSGYLAALKAGRSFVTTGPLLQFTAGGAEPGGVRQDLGRGHALELNVASAVPFERVEVLVNGEVAWSGDGLTSPARRRTAAR